MSIRTLNLNLGGIEALPDSEYKFIKSSKDTGGQIWTLEKNKPYWEVNDHVAATIANAVGAECEFNLIIPLNSANIFTFL